MPTSLPHTTAIIGAGIAGLALCGDGWRGPRVEDA